MKQILLTRVTLNNSGTLFYHPGIAVKADLNGEQEGAGQSTESDTYFICPCDGEISNLYVNLASAPTAGRSWTFTVRNNAVDTTVTFSISDTSTTGNSATNSFAVNEGDLVSISVSSSGTPTNVVASLSLEFSGTTTGISALYGGSKSVTGLVSYIQPGIYDNLASAGSTSERNRSYIIVPHDCTIKGLYVNLTTAPGGVTSRTLTLAKGPFGSVNNTTATVTISGTNTTGNITGLSVAVTAGEILIFNHGATGAVAASRIMYSVILESATDGYSIKCFAGGVSGRNDGYVPMFGGKTNVVDGGVGDDTYVGNALTLSNMYWQLDSFHSALDTKVVTLEKNGIATACTFTFSTAVREMSNTANSVDFAVGDNINVSVDHTGTGSGLGQSYTLTISMFVNPVQRRIFLIT